MTTQIIADRDSSFGQAISDAGLGKELFVTVKDDMGDVKWSGVVNAYRSDGLRLTLDLELVTSWIDGKLRDFSDLVYLTARNIGIL